VLFSNDQVSKVINDSFEPVWISVRPVPTVRIDFGNGQVITRTLHGNIATSVCTAEGKVLDIMPGVYDPQTYQRRLTDFQMLHLWLKQKGGDPVLKMKQYHTKQVAALAAGKPPLAAAAKTKAKPPATAALRIDVSKNLRVERPLKLVLMPSTINKDHGNLKQDKPKLFDSKNSSTLWETLKEDTRANETTRRLMVHRYLAKNEMPQAEGIVKWLYSDVLHTDLDDPYMGLGKLLFATYPFAEEDREP